MRQDKKQPSLDFFKGRMNFNDKDPYWYRLVVIIIFVVFIIALAWRLNGLPLFNGRIPAMFSKENYQAGRSP